MLHYLFYRFFYFRSVAEYSLKNISCLTLLKDKMPSEVMQFIKHKHCSVQAQTDTYAPFEPEKRPSHSIIGGTPAPFRHHPVDVLAGVLDVAGFTVDTVLSVYLQPHPVTRFHGNVLVHT